VWISHLLICFYYIIFVGLVPYGAVSGSLRCGIRFPTVRYPVPYIASSNSSFFVLPDDDVNYLFLKYIRNYYRIVGYALINYYALFNRL
jgi:hypothetical protein